MEKIYLITLNQTLHGIGYKTYSAALNSLVKLASSTESDGKKKKGYENLIKHENKNVWIGIKTHAVYEITWIMVL